jgi:hypothetical protein
MEKKKTPFLCKISAHDWIDLRDPDGVRRVSYSDFFGFSIPANNRVCKKCGKKDMFADRLRKKMKDDRELAEKIAVDIYKEKQ